MRLSSENVTSTSNGKWCFCSKTKSSKISTVFWKFLWNVFHARAQRRFSNWMEVLKRNSVEAIAKQNHWASFHINCVSFKTGWRRCLFIDFFPNSSLQVVTPRRWWPAISQMELLGGVSFQAMLRWQFLMLNVSEKDVFLLKVKNPWGFCWRVYPVLLFSLQWTRLSVISLAICLHSVLGWFFIGNPTAMPNATKFNKQVFVRSPSLSRKNQPMPSNSDSVARKCKEGALKLLGIC